MWAWAFSFSLQCWKFQKCRFFFNLFISQNKKQFGCCFLLVVWFLVLFVCLLVGFLGIFFVWAWFWFLVSLIVSWVFFLSECFGLFIFVCMFSLKIWVENCSESNTNWSFCLFLGFVSAVLWHYQDCGWGLSVGGGMAWETESVNGSSWCL